MNKRTIGRSCAVLAICLTLGTVAATSARAVSDDDKNKVDYVYSETADSPEKDSVGASSSAANGNTLSFTAKKNDTVEVHCKLKNTKNALGIQESMSYDSSAIELVSQTQNAKADNFDFAVNNDTKGTVAWSEMFAPTGTDFVSETDIVTFKFKALKEISGSENVLSYKVDEFFDNASKDINTGETAIVDVIVIGDWQTEEYTYGDVNSDDSVDSLDALLILREIVGLEPFDDIQKEIGDVDSDGGISSNDALLVLRYAVGYKDDCRVGQKNGFMELG